MNKDFDYNFCRTYGKVSYLLKRDEPKMVRYEADGYANGIPVYDTAYCPNCNHYFDLNYDEQTNFCPECGQRLKWEENEK